MNGDIQVIVNADDLGISVPVNNAIFGRMKSGAVTSATILANGPAVEDAVRRLPEYPNCSFGVHLDLSEFRSIHPSSPRALAAIMNGGGVFKQGMIRSVKITPSLLSAIYSEWCAQIDKLIRMNVPISHVDSHYHVHTIPQLLPVLAILRRRYKIHRIRMSRNIYDATQGGTPSLLAKKRLYNTALRVAGYQGTENFTDLVTFCAVQTLQRPSGRRVELMVHPGGANLQVEESLLDSDWPAKMSYPVRLISFKEL